MIAAWQGDGLTFTFPATQSVQNIRFDGKEYKGTGPQEPPNSVSTGRRIDSRTAELTDKVDGKVIARTTAQVSADGKTMTMKADVTGQAKPLAVVYEKQ